MISDMCQAASEVTVLDIAETFCTDFTWSCEEENLNDELAGWTCPRYVSGPGNYSSMPYCWGGFNSIAEYNEGIDGGGNVGNINATGGHLSGTYGLDCSGYVSRCWGQTEKYGTTTLHNISTEITYNSLRSGDALNLAGFHVVLFDYSDQAGRFVLYEATKWNSYDRVVHTVRTSADLSSAGYVAIRYDGITN